MYSVCINIPIPISQFRTEAIAAAVVLAVLVLVVTEVAALVVV